MVVTGMHRSGTSAVAGCLHRLGVDFGPRLMPATPDNLRGFYEHIDIVNLHDRLLLAGGSSWDATDPKPAEWLAGPDTARFRQDLRVILARDFAEAPLWGLKDPRLCHLLPWWQPIWAELQTRPLFVVVLRDPREVVASLARRDGFSPGKAYLLWLQHTLAAERATRGGERVFIDFANFLADWRRAVAPVGAWLEQPWELSLLDEAAPAEPVVDRALAQINRSGDDAKAPLWVEEADAALRRERRTGRDLSAVFDKLAGHLAAAQALYGGARDHTNDAARRIAALEQQARWYEAEWQKASRRAEASSLRLDEERRKTRIHEKVPNLKRET